VHVHGVTLRNLGHEGTTFDVPIAPHRVNDSSWSVFGTDVSGSFLGVSSCFGPSGVFLGHQAIEAFSEDPVTVVGAVGPGGCEVSIHG